MPYVNVTKSETGANTGSCGDLVAYLEKENKYKQTTAHERWFDQERDDIGPQEVQKGIDSNVAKLKKTEAKFFLVNISPSEKELAHIRNDPEKLKAYGRQVMEEYAKNFQKGMEGKDLRYYGKVEYNRYYKYSDEEVKAGKAIRGDLKEGNHMHVQIIVSRKDQSNSKLLSPLNNSSGRNEVHSKKFGQFNIVNFKQNSEQAFDRQFDYRRDLQESFRYLNTMQNGSISEKADLILAIRETDHTRAKEKELQLEQQEATKKMAEKVESEKKEQELKQKQEVEKKPQPEQKTQQEKNNKVEEKQELSPGQQKINKGPKLGR